MARSLIRRVETSEGLSMADEVREELHQTKREVAEGFEETM